MEPTTLPPTRDAEFAPHLAGQPSPPPFAQERYQRLIVNPFLGFSGVLAWGVALWLVFRSRRRFRHLPSLGGPWIDVIVVMILAVTISSLPLLFHYHCLDCGATGVLHRWRRHACAPVLDRYHAGRPRRVRGPTPPIQFLMWLFALAAGLIALKEIGLMGR